MIHRQDERAFRFIEVTSYVGFLVSSGFLKVHRGDQWPYHTPLSFVALSGLGIVFMLRYFIYAYPERIWDRTRAERVDISRSTKATLVFGFVLCVPMLIIGSIGFYDSALMNRIITMISPMRFMLD